ncbi:MAG TPA: hypothetical protein VJL28_04000 [Gemmatimonadaceae bacterium]|nr:hypothetical protein [Gemmatimonadaceae bacterium]
MRPDRSQRRIARLSGRMFAACGVLTILAAASGDCQAVRDSGGVRIVSSASPVWKGASVWRVDAKPLVEIGGGRVEGDDLGIVSAAVIAPPGRIVVGDKSVKAALVFDLTGNPIGRFGREGAGPGDFQTIGHMQLLAADSILIGNAGLGADIWSASGKLLQRTRMPLFRFPGVIVNPMPVGRMRSGHFVGIVSLGPFMLRPGGDSTFHFTSALAIVDRGGREVARVGPIPAGGDRWSTLVGGLHASDVLPFTSTTTVRVFGDRVYVATGQSFDILRYDAAGRLREIFRRDAQARTVRESERLAFRKWYAAGIERHAQTLEGRGNKTSAKLTREIDPVWLRKVPFPAALPAIENFVIDTRGYIWVDDYVSITDSVATWSVIDPTGRYLGSIARPRDSRTLFVGDTLILGLTEQDDVQLVRLYRIRRPTP